MTNNFYYLLYYVSLKGVISSALLYEHHEYWLFAFKIDLLNSLQSVYSSLCKCHLLEYT